MVGRSRHDVIVAASAGNQSGDDSKTQRTSDERDREEQTKFDAMNKIINQKHDEKIARLKASNAAQSSFDAAPSLAFRWYSKVEINGLRRVAAVDACKARGLDDAGTLPDLKRRLLVSCDEDPLPHMIDIYRTLDTMSRADIEAELQARGVMPVGAKSELKEILQGVLVSEYPNNPNAAPLRPITSAAPPEEEEEDGIPENFRNMRIKDLQAELRRRGVPRKNNIRKEELLKILMDRIAEQAVEEATALKNVATEAAQQQDLQRELEQQRVWQQTRQLLDGSSGDGTQGEGARGDRSFGEVREQMDPQDSLVADQFDGRGPSVADSGWQQSQGGDEGGPEQTIFLDDIYPDGYDELYDLNLNELGDDRIVQELKRRQLQAMSTPEESVELLTHVLREELVATLSDEEIMEEVRQRGLNTTVLDPREWLRNDMVGDAARDVLRDAADFVDKLSDEDVLLEAEVRNIAIPIGGSVRDALRTEVERQLRHNYGNVNTLYIYAAQMEDFSQEQQHLRAWADDDAQVAPEPPLTIALIVGGPGSEASRYDAFCAAAGLAQHLRTAPMSNDEDEDEGEEGGVTRVRPPYGLLLDMWRSEQPEDAGGDGEENEEDLPSFLTSGGIAVQTYYIDGDGQAWLLALSDLLGSSATELDSKLAAETMEPLPDLQAMARDISDTADIAWPVVHGAWGESGELQRILTDAGVNFVGCDTTASAAATDKLRLNDMMIARGYPAVPRMPLRVAMLQSESATRYWIKDSLTPWLEQQDLNPVNSRLFVKPARGSNSDGVTMARGVDGVLEAAMNLANEEDCGPELVIEPQVATSWGDNKAGGVPFSVHVITTALGPLALPPTEMACYDVEHDIRASFLALHRELYLKQGFQPEVVELMLEALRAEVAGQEDNEEAFLSDPLRASTSEQQLRLHTPMRLPAALTSSLRLAAARLFTDLGLRDHARLDGWVMLPMSFEGMEHMMPTAEDFDAHAAGLEIDHAGTEQQRQQREAVARSKAGMVDEDGLPITAATTMEAAKAADRREEEDAVEREVELNKRRATFERMLQDLDIEDDVEFDVPADFVESDGGAERFVDVLLGNTMMDGDTPDGKAFFSRLAQPDKAIMMEEHPEDLDDEAEEGEGEEEEEEESIPDPQALTPEEMCRRPEGTIVFADVNLRSDTAVDSLLFHQAAAVGMSHSAMLRHLTTVSAARGGLPGVRAPETLTPSVPVVYHPEEVDTDVDTDGIFLQEFADTIVPALPPRRSRPQLASAAQQQLQQPMAALEDEIDTSQSQPGSLQSEAGASTEVDTTEALREVITRLPPKSLELLKGVPESEQANIVRDVLGIPFDQPQDEDVAANTVSDTDEDAAAAQQAQPEQHEQHDSIGYSVSQPAATEGDAANGTRTSKVWVLMGGEGSGRHAALAAGQAAFLACAGHGGGDAKAILLAPWAAGLNENRRRKELLRRRNKYLNIGIAESELAEQQLLSYIRQPFEGEEEPFILKQGTWQLPYGTALSPSCEAIVESCEAALALANTGQVAASHGEIGKGHEWEQARAEAQEQLSIAGVDGVGALFGGRDERPDPPAYMDLASLLERAVAEGAVLWLALSQNDYVTNGLQEILEELRIPFTGPSSISAKLCGDRTEFAKQLATEANYKGGITTPPQKELETEALVNILDDPEALEALWEELVNAAGANSASSGMLSIRPAQNCGAQGAATLSCAEDLAWYGNAIAESWVRMPVGTLELQVAPIEMPFPVTETLVLEPWINPFSVVLQDAPDDEDDAISTIAGSGPVSSIQDGGGGASEVIGSDPPAQLTWVEDVHWARVTWCLVGQLGEMLALPPTLHVAYATDDGTVLEAEGTLRYTPVPEAIVSEASLAEAAHRVRRVSQQLALRGAAVIHTFVQAESGDIVVVDVTPGADLSLGSIFEAQGLAHDPPLDATRLARLIAAEAVAACSELPQQNLQEVDPKGYYSSVYLDAGQNEETASDPLFGRGTQDKSRRGTFVADPSFGGGTSDPFFDSGSSPPGGASGWGGQTGLTQDDWQLKGEYSDRAPPFGAPTTGPGSGDPYLRDEQL